MRTKKLIGFIGQGYIGKNHADDFENRGYEVVRYALEDTYKANGGKIKDCDIVFIAVPTPTTIAGFNANIVKKAVKIVGKGKVAVIKSTLLPGMTELIQKENPDIYVFHSPEFLVAANAAYDAAHPKRNIIGIPSDTEEYKRMAKEIMAILPHAPFKLVCGAREAEIIKYGGNIFLYFKIIYANILYDSAISLGCAWETVRDAIAADERIGKSHMQPAHDGGRGAGGACLIKDFAAFHRIYKDIAGDESGTKILEALEEKNIELLYKSKKDLDLLKGVYGENIFSRLNN